MRLRKRPQEVVALTNVAVQLVGTFAQGKHHALAHVDPLGVIERLRFEDVAREAAQWAGLLREQGVKPGDRVVVLAERDRHWRCALLGVLQAGGVAVPCPSPAPVAEIRGIAGHAGAVLYVSARARADLVEPDGPTVLSADDLERHKAAKTELQPPDMALPGEVALILYARDAAGLRGAMHTHASLLAQAKAGEHWLGVGKKERVWCTAADGSLASIWILLAAWTAGAEIVDVEYTLDPEAELELLDRFHPAAVWFSDDEYAELASLGAPAWVDLASTRRALTSDEPADGAIAFQDAIGAKAFPVYGTTETGVVAGSGVPVPGIELAILDEEGNELPSGEVGAVVLRGDTPSLFAGYHGSRGSTPRPDEWFRVGGRGTLDGEGMLRLAPPARVESAHVEAEAIAEPVGEHQASAAVVSDEPQAPSRRKLREEKHEQRKAAREAKERREIDERRRAEEAKTRELAERAAAAERQRLEEAERANRAAELAVERRLAEDAKHAERGLERAEKKRLADEQRRREEEEKRSAEEASRAASEAARAEKGRVAEAMRRRADEDKRRAKLTKREEREAARAEKKRLVDEAKQRAEDEKRRAEEAKRAEREDAIAEKQRLAEDEKQRAADEKKRAEEAKRAEREAAIAEKQRVADEERRRVEEEKQRVEDEKTRAEEAKRAEREAAIAEKQRLADEKERLAADEKQRAEDEKRHAEEDKKRAEEAKRAEREAAIAEKQRLAEAEKQRTADEKKRAEEAKRAEREAAKAEKQRLADEKERRAKEEKQRAEEAKSGEREAARAEKEQRRERAEQAERERVAAEADESQTDDEQVEREAPKEREHALSATRSDIVSRISEYGMTTPKEPSEPPGAA